MANIRMTDSVTLNNSPAPSLVAPHQILVRPTSSHHD
jgi:hypothetical protein